LRFGSLGVFPKIGGVRADFFLLQFYGFGIDVKDTS
jgi:hypothetical protein